MSQKEPYGFPFRQDGIPRCVNAQPGTYGHECSREASWIGTNTSGFRACYCDRCKAEGYEARDCTSWEALRASTAWKGWKVALLAGMVGAVLLSGEATRAAAAAVCGERSAILETLAKRHGEAPRGIGLASDGRALEVLVSPGGSWTMLATGPDGQSCVVAVGEAWQEIDLISGDPA